MKLNFHGVPTSVTFQRLKYYTEDAFCTCVKHNKVLVHFISCAVSRSPLCFYWSAPLSAWFIPAAHTGPRFTLNLIKIFDGSFGGASLYENPVYQTPNAVSSSLQCYCHFSFVPKHRRVVKQLASQKYKLKVKHSQERKERRRDEQTGLPVDPLADVFDTRSN